MFYPPSIESLGQVLSEEGEKMKWCAVVSEETHLAKVLSNKNADITLQLLRNTTDRTS
jgi:hypothetical protein